MRNSKSKRDYDAHFHQLVSDALKKSTAGKTYYHGTLLGIIIGGIVCIVGFTVSILGIAGSIEWIFEASNLKSRLVNASPGVFFALLGMIILWRYKPTGYDYVSIKSDQSPTNQIQSDQEAHTHFVIGCGTSSKAMLEELMKNREERKDNERFQNN